MRRALPAAVVLSLLAAAASAQDTKPCTGRNGGKYYDLNGLASGDYSVTTPGGHELTLSACKAVTKETWGLDDPKTVGGFVRKEHGDFSLGTLNTTLSFSSRAGYPHLTYAGGSKCVDSNGNKLDYLRGATEIEFVCDPAAGRGTPRLIAQLPPGGDTVACAYVFEWRSVSACATSEGVTFGSFIWFLFSTSLILLFAYLVIGFLYNTFALNQRGMAAVPRFSFASMVYHMREAADLAREWWATQGPGRGAFGLREGGRGVGVGVGGGFGASRDAGRAEEGENTFGKANAFIRTRKDQPGALNPASHQNQSSAAPPVLNTHSASASASASPRHSPMPIPVPMPAPTLSSVVSPSASGLNPASHQAQMMQGQGQAREDMPLPALPTELAPTSANAAVGLNPASHQAQVMSGMPVSHLSRTPAQQQQQQQGGMPPLTPGRERFSLGEGEEEEEDGEEEGEEEEEGEGAVRL
ncbi:PLCXc domain-containing protein [Mycena chlorophos]|uniref:PLCXc domain-containing protein n=1 Tax=Mycena chlorophos TaxID=658473 RepID=A0A8H6SJ68_MYCCL|nr:PLCXc domain-containing protein [Mycena chlorophos]